MAQGKELYQGQPAATAAAIYTASYDTVIGYMVAVNTDSSARTLKLWVGGSDDDNVILPATSLDASGGKAEFGGGIFLAKGQALYAVASAASKVTLTIFGDLNTDGAPLSVGAGAGWAFYDASGRVKSVQAIGELADVGDVTITSVADNEVLAYDSSGTAWINQTAAEAGLQAAITQSTADTANPPTAAELTTAFGAPATVGDGFTGILDDGGGGSNYYLCIVINGAWTYVAMTAAA